MLPETIDTTRYRGYLPPLAPAEKARLRASLLAEGCRDRLVVGRLPDGSECLIDGFNRLDIASESKIVAFGYQVIDFPTEDAMLLWIESNSRSRRSETRTTRNYFIGCRYLREKQPEPGRPKKRKGVPNFDDTARRIGLEERCSDRHVRTCGKLAEHIAEACSYGLDFVRPLLLTERLKYSRPLLRQLIDRGAGGCQEIIERLVSQAEGKPVTWGQVKKALGLASGRKVKAALEQAVDMGNALVAAAECEDVEEVRHIITTIEDNTLPSLRRVLAAKKESA